VGTFRRRAAALVASVITAATVALVMPPAARAVPQTGGDDVAGWATNWRWTYSRTFHYEDLNGTNVTVNESVNYTVGGPVTFMGQDAWQVNIAGSVTSGSGKACSGGTGPSCSGGTSANLNFTGGSVTGTEYVRQSDLAEIQEHETQNFIGTAAGLVAFNATFDTTITPDPSWRTKDFRLHSGDTWNVNENIVTTGTFSYSAGSFGSGSGPLDGTKPFTGTMSVAPATMTEPIAANIATDAVKVTSTTGDEHFEWWAPAYKNNAETHTKSLGSDGSQLILDTHLASVNIATPAVSATETISPSLACGGQQVTVSGALSTGQSGQPVSVSLDQSILVPGQAVTAATTTGAGGNYSTTLTAPLQADGLSKPDTRGAWGIVVSVAGAKQAATLEVRPEDCSSLAYTGPTSAAQGATATLSALLTDTGTNQPVSGATITFALSGQAGTVSGVTGASGVATANLSVAGPPRAATVSASFAGNPTLLAASSSTGFTVTVDATQTSVTSSEPSATIGDSITFTATVTPTGASVATPPGGTVQFSVDGSPLGGPAPVGPGGVATSISTNTLSIGSHDVVGVYSGDANYGASTSPVFKQIVHKVLIATSTSVTSSQNPTVYGQPTTLTATVVASGGGTPTGGITFKDGATVIGTGTLNQVPGSDQASAVVDSLGVGTHNVTAVYEGDDDYATSASPPITQTVLQAQTSTAVTPSDPAPVAGEPLSFSVAVTPVAPGAGTPTGTANLSIDGHPVGGAVAVTGGVATIPAGALSAGSHTISATYNGDTNFAASSTSRSLVVGKASTSTVVFTSPNPSVTDQPVTFTATVTAVAPGAGTPTGLVTFRDGTTVLGSASLAPTVGGAQASMGLSTLSVGSHVITATYAGDANDVTSTSDSVTQVVNQAPPTIDTTTAVGSSTNPSRYGQPIAFTATVTAASGSAAPTGTVQFSVDGTDLGGPVTLDSSGVAASDPISSLAAGSHTVIAAYSGAVGFAASGLVTTQAVQQSGTSASIATSNNPAPFGQSLTFTATLGAVAPGAGTPGGKVQFRVDSVAVGSPVTVTAGQAISPAISGLDPGHHTISILTSGDPNFSSTTASYDELVNKIPTTTALTATPNPAVYGSPVTLTATVTGAGPGTPTGTVTFSESTTVLGTGPLSTVAGQQQASITVSSLSVGSHTLTAAYAGDDRFAASSTTVFGAVVIQKAPTSISANPAVLGVKTVLGPPVVTQVTLLEPLQATLIDANGMPIANQPVVFAAGSTLCTSTTNAQGVAYCNQLSAAALTAILLNRGYTATYGGNASYLGSATAASVIKITVH
jgi:Big-like domain-containing protein